MFCCHLIVFLFKINLNLIFIKAGQFCMFLSSAFLFNINFLIKNLGNFACFLSAAFYVQNQLF